MTATCICADFCANFRAFVSTDARIGRTFVKDICLCHMSDICHEFWVNFRLDNCPRDKLVGFYSFLSFFFRTLEPQPQKHLVVCSSAFLPFPSFLFANTMPPPPGKKYKSELWSHFTVSNANSKGQAVKVCAYREHALLCWCNVLQH